MADNEDTIGCVVTALLLAGGAWWLYNKYEVKERVVEPYVAPRPAYPIYVTTLDNGTIWKLDSASVIGPRTARQAWILEDHVGNKERVERETKTLYRINCDTTGYQTVELINYDKSGKVVSSWDEKAFGDQTSYAPPGTYIAGVVGAACDPRFDSPAKSTPEVLIPPPSPPPPLTPPKP